MKTLQLIYYIFNHPEIKSVYMGNKKYSDSELFPMDAIENLSAYWDVDEKTSWRINSIGSDLVVNIIEGSVPNA